jgi:anthranilate synthase component 1
MHIEALPGRVDPLSLHRLDPQRYPFLLQSAAAHPQAGRYDIVFAFPQESIEIGAGGDHAGFFAALDRLPLDASLTAEPHPLPFLGGWFLLLGYEAVRGVEPRLRLPDAPQALPDMLAVRCPAAVVVDRLRERTFCIAESDPAQLAQLRADVAAAVASPTRSASVTLIEHIEEDRPQRFLDGVQRIRDYLRDGDVFQVNLSRRWQARLLEGVSAAELFANLCSSNPAPFAGLAQWRGSTVLSSSPERLIEIDGGIAQTRPIAGTRARRDGDEDLRQREKLIGSLKERAEHVMLIDLERNDLGRVCVPGSVEVSELMTIESYAHVHHIVSNVRGRLRDGIGPGSALRAVFPGGTITGAPKVRAMEIIAELEGTGRGAYTGAMGYLSRHGRLDSNILIRSLLVENGVARFRAGAGIVADSEPAFELAETRAKARGLLLALGAQA